MKHYSAAHHLAEAKKSKTKTEREMHLRMAKEARKKK